MGEPAFRRGVGRLASFDLAFDAMLFHPQIRELTDLHPRRAGGDVHPRSPRRHPGHRAYAGKREEILGVWHDLDELGDDPERRCEGRQSGMVDCGLGFETWTGAIERQPRQGVAWSRSLMSSSDSARNVSCSWRTFPSTRCPAATSNCGTPSRRSPWSSATWKASLFHDTAARVLASEHLCCHELTTNASGEDASCNAVRQPRQHCCAVGKPAGADVDDRPPSPCSVITLC